MLILHHDFFYSSSVLSILGAFLSIKFNYAFCVSLHHILAGIKLFIANVPKLVS